MNHPQQPREYDAVLGGNIPSLEGAAVLGGIEGVKLRLQNPDSKVRIAALEQAVNYGEQGLDLVIAGLKDESVEVQNKAYLLLDNLLLIPSPRPVRPGNVSDKLYNEKYSFLTVNSKERLKQILTESDSHSRLGITRKTQKQKTWKEKEEEKWAKELIVWHEEEERRLEEQERQWEDDEIEDMDDEYDENYKRIVEERKRRMQSSEYYIDYRIDYREYDEEWNIEDDDIHDDIDWEEKERQWEEEDRQLEAQIKLWQKEEREREEQERQWEKQERQWEEEQRRWEEEQRRWKEKWNMDDEYKYNI